MKKILIVVDYQNDFVTGSLGFPQAEAIEEGIYHKIRGYMEEGHDVVFTLDTHYSQTYEKSQEGKKLPIMHCHHQSSGWELYGRIAQMKTDKTKAFSKYTFGSIDLAEYLKGKEYDQVELVGVVTDICVISNAILVKAALPEAEILIDALCVASQNPEMEQKAFDIMDNLQMTIINRMRFHS